MYYYVRLEGETPVLMVQSPNEIPQYAEIRVTQEEYEYYYHKDDPIPPTEEEVTYLSKCGEFRAFREVQFEAFDIYKQNINYGIIEETELEHDAICLWYIVMLDFPQQITLENACTIQFPETPEIIKQYL